MILFRVDLHNIIVIISLIIDFVRTQYCIALNIVYINQNMFIRQLLNQ